MRASRATMPASAACCPARISSPSPIRAGRRAAKGRSIDMSLLLEALKKAEEAQRRTRGEAEGAAEVPLDAHASPAPSAEPVMTRDQLPDIRQPLEIEKDEFETTPPPPAAEKKPAADAQASERATARKVFEA